DILVFSSSYLPLIQATVLFNQLVIVSQSPVKKPTKLFTIPVKNSPKDSINELYFSTKYSHIPTKNSTIFSYNVVKNDPTDSMNKWYFSTIYSHIPVKNSTILLYIVV